MTVAAIVFLASLGCAAGSEAPPAVVDSIDVADVMGDGWRIIDLDLLELLCRRAFTEVDASSLGVCFLSVGTDSLGAFADPPPELSERLADTGVDVRPWSRHELEGWADPVRDRETGELGATWTMRLAAQSTPRRLLFGLRVFPRRGDELHMTLVARRVGGKWTVTKYEPGTD